MRPRLYEAQPERMQVNLLPILDRIGLEFLEGNATGLDHSDRVLMLDHDPEIRYERLVIATGSTLRRPKVSRGSKRAASALLSHW